MAWRRWLMLTALGVACLGVASCGPSFSPNTYDTGAVQKANPVEQGVIVGVRAVGVSTEGTTGAVTGAAAGGIAGSQLPGGGATQALGALGGGLIGSLVGRSAEKVAGATTAVEYIVRKTDDKLISVTQQDEKPLAVGQHVLVIAGNQARIVPDYTVKLPEPPKPETITPVPPASPIIVTPMAPPVPLPTGSPDPEPTPLPAAPPAQPASRLPPQLDSSSAPG